MININKMLDYVIKYTQTHAKAIEAYRKWTIEEPHTFWFFENEFYFDSRDLDEVFSMLVSTHFVSEARLSRLRLAWKEVDAEFYAKKIKEEGEIYICFHRCQVTWYGRKQCQRRRLVVLGAQSSSGSVRAWTASSTPCTLVWRRT